MNARTVCELLLDGQRGDIERALADMESAALEFDHAADDELQRAPFDANSSVRAARQLGQASGLRLAALLLRDRCGLSASDTESAPRDGALPSEAATPGGSGDASPAEPPSMPSNNQHPSAARESAPVLATDA